MASWSGTGTDVGFHTRDEDRVWTPPREAIENVMFLPSPFQFAPNRWKRVAVVHEMIAKEWVNGGCVATFYQLDGGSLKGVEIETAHLIAALERIGEDRAFPKEIAGCSVEYLRGGKVWSETLQRFGNAIFLALSQGGAYSQKPLGGDKAREIVTNYIAAMFEDSPENSLFFFGLDPGFSSWFRGVYWDVAYTIFNTHENWLALILATDTD